jgi:hypothetical protein
MIYKVRDKNARRSAQRSAESPGETKRYFIISSNRNEAQKHINPDLYYHFLLPVLLLMEEILSSPRERLTTHNTGVLKLRIENEPTII